MENVNNNASLGFERNSKAGGSGNFYEVTRFKETENHLSTDSGFINSTLSKMKE